MRQIRFLMVAAFVMLSAPGWAQTTTGRLIGTTVDERGVGLPGVTVTISSPALIGGEQVKATDARGEFVFLSLAPGEYSVAAEIGGYMPQERARVKVSVGGAAALTIVMPAGRFTGEIDVRDETPVVDPNQVGAGQIFDAAYMQDSAVGSANRSYTSVIGQAAGVDLMRAAGWAWPSVFGSLYSENAYFLDGVDTTTAFYGEWGFTLNFDAVQEIALETGGFEAEFGRATGGIINVVTKSGGNLYAGTLDARYRGNSFQESGDFFDPSHLASQYWNAGATLGGRVVRDRLWFFASWQGFLNDETPFGSPTTQSTEDQNYMAKLTWAANASWRIVAKYTGNPWHIDNANASQFVSPEATGRNQGDVDAFSGELMGVLSDNLFLNLSGGRTAWVFDIHPSSGDLQTISHYNFDNNELTENFDYLRRFDDLRDDLSADLTWFVDGLGGSHEFKSGIEYSGTASEGGACTTGTTSTDGCTQGSSGFLFYDLGSDDPIPYLMLEDETAGPGSYDGSVRTAFAQDAWRVTRDLTLKIGLRYDTVSYWNNDGARVADMDKLQPRMGAAWDLTGDATSVLRASWGRYLHPNSLSLPQFASTLSQPDLFWYSCTTLMQAGSAEECAAMAADLGWDYSTDREGWDIHGWVLAPWERYSSEPGRIDPSLRATYADELLFAYEREVGARSSIELTYVNKKTRDVFEDSCNGNLTAPSSDAACDYFVITNLPDLRRDYEALIVRYETRRLSWLTLLTSYTLSKSRGSVENISNAGSDFDIYPWHFTNRYGYLSNHRRHWLKLNGFFNIEGDWTIAFDAFWNSPFTWTPYENRADNPAVPYGRHHLEPRGSREASSEYQLDLQLAKGFTAGGVRFVLIGSVLNALSSEQPTSVCEHISGCGFHDDGVPIAMGDSTEWQLPRRYELGFRVEF